MIDQEDNNIQDSTDVETVSKPSRVSRIINRGIDFWNYAATGVWKDTRRNWKINVLKTISLSARSFLNGDLQTQACAMTYRTMLAIVPALAMVFAIGRGFGFQNLLQGQLYKIFPGQQGLINQMLGFVDKYLSTASEGIFVGIGLLVLLWTLISLLSNVEDTFNLIWGVKQGRSIWRKLTDYTAMLLILPMLMICAAGLQMMMTKTLQMFMHISLLTPVVSVCIEIASWVFTWLFFTAVYMLIPNARVKFKNALIAGIFSGTGFLILQWLFVSGQMYVARYNAVYGSFSFLPLLLVWVQLVWVVCLSGAVLCYSSQSIFQFSFANDIDTISIDYRRRISLAVATVAVQSFEKNLTPPTVLSLVRDYDMPVRLVTLISDRLVEAGILSRVLLDKEKEIVGYQPAHDTSTITVASVSEALDNLGTSDFIPGFEKHFAGVETIVNQIQAARKASGADCKLTDIDITLPHSIAKTHIPKQ